MQNTSSQSSLIFLSLLCFAMADIHDGLGPFLGVYLQMHNWQPSEIGFIMTLGGFIGLLCNTPLGALADHSHKKRSIIIFCTCSILLACASIFYFTSPYIIGLAQVIQHSSAAAIMPAIIGISLGLVGQNAFSKRLGINEAFSHAGNATTAILNGIIGFYYGINGVFYVMLCMGILAIISTIFINPKHIDYATARGLSHSNQSHDEAKPQTIRTFFQSKALLIIAITLFFFHLGNASLLPLLGQSAVAQFDVNPAAYTASTIVLAQCTMIFMALIGAKIAKNKGYDILFILALIALPIRGLIAGLWVSPWNIIPVQILDGVGAGLLGVAMPGIVARIMQGSGHINMAIGYVLTIQGIGASLSNTYGGFFAEYFGYNMAFLGLAIAPCIGIILFTLAPKLLKK